MDLDKLHEVVKRLDSLLTHREEGLASWWLALVSHLGEMHRMIRHEVER